MAMTKNFPLVFFAIFLTGSSINSVNAEYSIDDGQLFNIQFQSFKSFSSEFSAGDIVIGDNEVPSKPEDPAKVGKTEADQVPNFESAKKKFPTKSVIMRSTNNEEYSCEIPMVNRKIDGENKDADGEDSKAYEGPTIMNIMNKLFVTETCAYRLEHYWTYELCHGKYVRQYHEERQGKEVKTDEYFLGKYNADEFFKDSDHIEKETAASIAAGKGPPKPRKKKIETMNLPYLEIVMKDGSVCDLNGQPRITRVHYVCYPTGKHEIFSMKETSTCEYEIVVLSPIVCTHPDYRPEESNEHLINCKPTSEKSPSTPKQLLELKTESLNLRLSNKNAFEGDFMQGENGGVKIEIKPVNPMGVGSAENLVEEEEDNIVQNKDSNWRSGPTRQPFKPLMDPQVVKEFLRGDYCLYGGSGWWKYEFCYGKKVEQYHEEKNGKRTSIKLGFFEKDSHLEWLEKKPNKRPKPVEVRKHVSHFYGGGDICDETKKPRHVEVKLKCMKSDSPSTVSLYLLEPNICEYILGVESPLVCDIINSADENGFMSIDANSGSNVINAGEHSKAPSAKAKEDFKPSPLDDGDWIPVIKKATEIEEEEEEEVLKAAEDNEKNQMTEADLRAFMERHQKLFEKLNMEEHKRAHQEALRKAANQDILYDEDHPGFGDEDEDDDDMEGDGVLNL